MGMYSWIRENPVAGLVDVVIAYSSLTVLYDIMAVRSISSVSASEYMKRYLQDAYDHAKESKGSKSMVKRIPVCYEEPFSPDLKEVASLLNISEEEIIALHTEKVYTVYMVGFLPGFPYMAEIDPRLVVSRKDRPRAHVEAGSVGIAGIQTGIYPVVSPGGWRIIGKTPWVLFNRNDDPPVKFEPGDQVSFYAVTKDEFHQLAGS